MAFYKENRINPAASCLPLAAQIPVFIALFYVLRDFEKEIFPDYPGSDLDWLNLIDITEKASSGWGPLLIVIYAASQLISTFLMSTTMEQRAQRILLMVLPIVFLPIIIQFPSGLVLYWVTTNLWTTGQGLVTRRLMPRPQPPPKRSSRTAPREEGGDGARREAPASAQAAAAPRRVKRKKRKARR